MRRRFGRRQFPLADVVHDVQRHAHGEDRRLRRSQSDCEHEQRAIRNEEQDRCDDEEARCQRHDPAAWHLSFQPTHVDRDEDRDQSAADEGVRDRVSLDPRASSAANGTTPTITARGESLEPAEPGQLDRWLASSCSKPSGRRQRIARHATRAGLWTKQPDISNDEGCRSRRRAGRQVPRTSSSRNGRKARPTPATSDTARGRRACTTHTRGEDASPVDSCGHDCRGIMRRCRIEGTRPGERGLWRLVARGRDATQLPTAECRKRGSPIVVNRMSTKPSISGPTSARRPDRELLAARSLHGRRPFDERTFEMLAKNNPPVSATTAEHSTRQPPRPARKRASPSTSERSTSRDRRARSTLVPVHVELQYFDECPN